MTTPQGQELGRGGLRDWSRGRWLLVAAVLVAIAIAVAVLLVVYSGGGGGSGGSGGY